jgi:hypothetical protein
MCALSLSGGSGVSQRSHLARISSGMAAISFASLVNQGHALRRKPAGR